MKPALGENQYIVQGDFNNSKEYVDYCINRVLESDLEFKCFRRFNYFYAFHNYIITKYPYYAIPSLPDKKVHYDTSEREKKLNLYINYLNKHEELKESNELELFLGEFTFVSYYF